MVRLLSTASALAVLSASVALANPTATSGVGSSSLNGPNEASTTIIGESAIAEVTNGAPPGFFRRLAIAEVGNSVVASTTGDDVGFGIRTGRDLRRIAREEFGDDLDIGRIADLDQRGAGRDALRALGQDAQDAPADRGADIDAADRARGRILDERGLGAVEFARAHVAQRRRACARGLGGLGGDPGAFERAERERAALREVLGTGALAAGEVELRLGLAQFALAQRKGRARGLGGGLGDRAQPCIEQLGRRRPDRQQHRLIRHDRIARVQRDPLHLAADRGRDGIDLSDAADPVLLDAHDDVARRDLGGFDRDGSGPEHPDKRRRQQQERNDRQKSFHHLSPPS